MFTVNSVLKALLMILFKKATDLRNYLDAQTKEGKTIGFIPTMGALHHGHISLAETSKMENDITVSSIFVNPTQFNDKKDFEKYPFTIEKDIQLLEEAGCDVLFLPSVAEMYPGGLAAKKHYELGHLETLLEGKYRPGHFQGVCMIVESLLKIVQPHTLYVGQKDYQQCMVITKLVELIGMKDRVKVNISPTLREPGGLAMSSRNMRLNEEEKKTATSIYKTLCFIKDNLQPGEVNGLEENAKAILAEKNFKIDYVEIADADSLQPVDRWDGRQKLVALVAVFLNDVRLIDNMIL
jgi:pantoate--beta-alanine ligase